MPLVLWGYIPNFERGYKWDIWRQMEGMHGNKKRTGVACANLANLGFWSKQGCEGVKARETEGDQAKKSKAKGQQSHAQVVQTQIQFLFLFISHIYLASLCYRQTDAVKTENTLTHTGKTLLSMSSASYTPTTTLFQHLQFFLVHDRTRKLIKRGFLKGKESRREEKKIVRKTPSPCYYTPSS